MIDDPSLLSAHLDGELTDSEAAVIEVHLASCPNCRREFDELRVARSVVRGLPLLNPPSEIFQPVAPATVSESRRHRWLMPVAAATVAVVVAVGVVAAPPTTEVPIRAVAAQHAAGSAGQQDVLLIAVPSEGIAP